MTTQTIKRQDLVLAKETADRRTVTLGRRNTVDQLLAKVKEQHGRVLRNARLTLKAMIAAGEYLEALRYKSPHGEWMERVEALGIKRSTAQNYRDIAHYKLMLERETGFVDMSLRGALTQVAMYKDSEKTWEDMEELEVLTAKHKPAKLKEARASAQGTRKVQRAAQLFVDAVHAYACDPEVDIDHVVKDTFARVTQILAQREELAGDGEG
jgi:hypothetical protein